MRQEINSNIISETEEYTEHLENLYRDDRKNYGTLPFIGNDDFFICFDINRQNKQQNAGSHTSRYTTLRLANASGNFCSFMGLAAKNLLFGKPCIFANVFNRHSIF